MINLLSELTQVTVLFLISRPQKSPLDHQTLHLLLLCDYFCSLKDNLMGIADDPLILRSYWSTALLTAGLTEAQQFSTI